MNLLAFFRGMPMVARQEFLVNVKSVRFIIMAVIMGLAVVGGAYGISSLTSGGPGIPPLLVWGHPSWDAGGNQTAVAWVSDPFGVPRADIDVRFSEFDNGTEVVIATVRTDGAGFARAGVGNREVVSAQVGSGTFLSIVGIDFFPRAQNFTSMEFTFFDLDNDRILDNFAFHVLDLAGNPAPARYYINGTFAKAADANGYTLLEMPVGQSNLTLEVGSESYTNPVYVDEVDSGPFGTPDFALFIASVFNALIVPIFAIVITFDSISKERVQGTMDLLLSRPVSRTGVLQGKFLGAFAAVGFPVVLVNVAGVAVITAASGASPTGGFVSAFLGYGLLLIALYVLAQLIFSSFAKSSGTAVLFGVLLFLLFNFLYNVVVFVLGSLLFRTFEGQFWFQQVAALGNPSQIYSSLIQLSAPPGLLGFFGGGGTPLEAWVFGAAASVWFAGLLVLALWVFQKRASD